MSKIIRLVVFFYKLIKFFFLVVFYLLTKHIPYYFRIYLTNYLINVPLKYIIYTYWIALSNKQIKIKKIKKKKMDKPMITFGFTHLINHKYFYRSLKNNHYNVQVIIRTKGSFIDDADYATTYDEILDKHYKIIPKLFRLKLKDLLVFDYVLKTTDVLVMDYLGYGPDEIKHESNWYKRFGIITVIFPFGSDYWMYSSVIDQCYKHALMINYPTCGTFEKNIRKRVEYWTEHADCIVNGGMIDGASRWDSLPCNFLCIDTELWRTNLNRPVNKDKIVVAHAPNHRYVKGTEFILKAIEKLKDNGYNVELLLFEKFRNDQLMEILKNKVDVFIEKLNYCIYGLSAIEAMSLGIPVISSINHPLISPLFRRFSYFNECPIVDANHENLYDVIKYLLDNESFRYQIGNASRKYVEKYHSLKSFSDFFDLICQKYWVEDPSVDLINCFHPLNPNRLFSGKENIDHPLINNFIPELINHGSV